MGVAALPDVKLCARRGAFDLLVTGGDGALPGPSPVRLVSIIERQRTADEPIAAKVKLKQCNADPFALPDLASSEPQLTSVTKVDPVQSAVNLQGGTQPSRAACQLSHAPGAAISLHERDADDPVLVAALLNQRFLDKAIAWLEMAVRVSASRPR
jgi:hypothetical protein